MYIATLKLKKKTFRFKKFTKYELAILNILWIYSNIYMHTL